MLAACAFLSGSTDGAESAAVAVPTHDAGLGRGADPIGVDFTSCRKDVLPPWAVTASLR